MVQNNSGESENKNPLWQRINEAFGTDDVQSIASKLGITYQGVDKWKKDKTLPSNKRFRQMSDLTGRSIDWLMTGKENLTEEEREVNRFTNLSNKFGGLSPSKKARADVLIEMLERELERMETEPD